MKTLLVIVIFGAAMFLCGRYFNGLKEFYKRLSKNYKPGFGLTVLVGIVFLFLGIIIGRKADRDLFSRTNPVVREAMEPAGFISDFETEKDLAKWETRQSQLERSTDHATHGQYSGKMIFQSETKVSNVLLESFLQQNQKFGDWSESGQVRFELYNPDDKIVKLSMKLKDEQKKDWGRSFFIGPRETMEVEIDLKEVAEVLDISKIRQFNFFRWKPDQEVVVYIDNIRLISKKKVNNQTDQSPNQASFYFESPDDVLGLGVETAMRKVFQDPGQFKGQASHQMEVALARNEYEAVQLAVLARKDVNEIEVVVQDLIAQVNGEKILLNKANITPYFVGHVETVKPGYYVSYVGWWPDPLKKTDTFSIKKGQAQTLWVEVFAPESLHSGDYSGKIILKYDGNQTETIGLTVHVWDMTLPKETHLKTAFDFYHNRLRGMYPKDPQESQLDYGDRMNTLQEKYYLDMIGHRIMPVFNFDVKHLLFKKEILHYLDRGLSSFALGPHTGSHGNNWPRQEEELNGLIEKYRDAANILKAAGLLEKAYIYTYDEPSYGDPHVDQVAAMVHRADPGLRNMVALSFLDNPDNFPGWGKDVDIWCIRNVMFNKNIAEIYRQQGKELWIYVSGPQPPYPSLVIDYPALAYRVIPWMAWKFDIKGYLFWCVNFWKDDPWISTTNTDWKQNGNGYLYYPGKEGPVPSIRLKVTRDGLEDYEYFYLLKEKLDVFKHMVSQTTDSDLIARAEKLLNIDETMVKSMGDYASEPEIFYQRRRDIAEMIEELNDVRPSR